MAISHERERALVVAAVAGVMGESWPVRAGLAGLDWAWIVARLREHGIAGRFWAEAVRARIDGDIPAATRARLEDAAQNTAALTAQRRAAAVGAGEVLERAGVPWVALKGAALAFALPDYAATREFADVDLLVPPDALPRASAALAAVHPLTVEVRPYDGRARDATAATRDGVHALYAFRGRGDVPIDLHHVLPGLPSREVTEAVLGRAAPVAAGTRRVLVPSPEDLLGIACVHAVLHHEGDRRIALRHLSDVSELVAAGASEDLARERYDVGGRLAVASSLRELAAAREDACVRGAPTSRASVALDPGFRGRVGERVALARGRGARIARGLRQHGLDAVLPPRSFMIGLYGPGATGARLPLLHLHRWVKILLRVVKGR